MDFRMFLDRSHPVFWVALTILGIGVIWLAGGVFSLLGSVIWYAIVFALAGGVLYAADEYFRTTLLRRRSTRFAVAVVVSLIWLGMSGQGWIASFILAAWSFLVLLTIFQLAPIVWKNRDAMQRQFDDVVEGRVDPVTAARSAAQSAAGAVGDSARRGVDDAHSEATRYRK